MWQRLNENETDPISPLVFRVENTQFSEREKQSRGMIHRAQSEVHENCVNLN